MCGERKRERGRQSNNGFGTSCRCINSFRIFSFKDRTRVDVKRINQRICPALRLYPFAIPHFCYPFTLSSGFSPLNTILVSFHQRDNILISFLAYKTVPYRISYTITGTISILFFKRLQPLHYCSRRCKLFSLLNSIHEIHSLLASACCTSRKRGILIP